MERLKIFGAVCVVMGLAACGDQSDDTTSSSPSPSPSVAPAIPSPSPSPSPTASPSATPPPARAVEGTRNVRFGDKFQLDGAFVTHEGDGTKVDLHWQSLAAQPLNYTVSVHLVNERGDILSQTDHAQDAAARAVNAGESWQDSVLLKAGQLKGADAVAICVYHPGGDILNADRGRRDWNNARLWIPLSGGQ